MQLVGYRGDNELPDGKVTKASCSNVSINQLQPMVDMDLVPRLLHERGSANYLLSDYSVIKDNNNEVIFTAPPIVNQPKFHWNDTDPGMQLVALSSCSSSAAVLYTRILHTS